MKTNRIGIIGTGMLGNAVGTNLLDSNFDLIVYNRTKEKTRELQKKGAKIANSPKEVAENADIVIIIVKDSNAVKEISFGKNGIADAKHNGIIVADMSTISPIESKNISKKFLDIGIIKLDTPVMGGPNVAITGDLVLIVSGKRETFDKVRHIFEKIGKKIFFVEGSGTAHLIKLAMNLQIALLALALSEGITLVKSAKLDPQIFLDVLNATYFKTGMSENKAPKMIKGEFEPTFTLSNMKKDITTITETANSLGITLPMIKKAEEVYNKAIQNGFGEIDYTGILDHLREINEKSS